MAVRRRSTRGPGRRRPYGRVRTVREVRQIAKRQDDREVKKLEGKWYPFSNSITLTAKGTNYYLPLPLPTAGSQRNNIVGQLRGITIYGMNTLITMTNITAGSESPPLIGAIAATVLREDENESDLPLMWPPRDQQIYDTDQPLAREPHEVLIANERPWRWFQPFAVARSGGNPMKSVAFPFNFRRGHQIYLPPSPTVQDNSPHDGNPKDGQGPRFTLVFCLSQSSQQASLQVTWHGRYRFIEKPLT